MTELLRCEGVSKHFGGLKAVDDVDFHLDEDEVLGLIGPNGAGKSTLFSVVAGSVPPTQGRVLLAGHQVSGRRPHRAVHRGVCRTHQIVRPFDRMSVLENVLVGAYYGDRRRAGSRGTPEDRASELLDFMGLAGKENNLCTELTLGDKKRLEVARALATAPRVLLLDEMVAGLNPAEAASFMRLIRVIRQTGVAIMIIEHVMQAVMGLSDRIMVLDHGKKIAEGTPGEVAQDQAVIEAYLGKAGDADGIADAGGEA